MICGNIINRGPAIASRPGMAAADYGVGVYNAAFGTAQGNTAFFAAAAALLLLIAAFLSLTWFDRML